MLLVSILTLCFLHIPPLYVLPPQIPVVIDVFFKYWIFIGLNKISPGAVVTIKQIDTH